MRNVEDMGPKDNDPDYDSDYGHMEHALGGPCLTFQLTKAVDRCEP